eukprot:3380337-Lingulodinium_polyedra.AAC.1
MVVAVLVIMASVMANNCDFVLRIQPWTDAYAALFTHTPEAPRLQNCFCCNCGNCCGRCTGRFLQSSRLPVATTTTSGGCGE